MGNDESTLKNHSHHHLHHQSHHSSRDLFQEPHSVKDLADRRNPSITTLPSSKAKITTTTSTTSTTTTIPKMIPHRPAYPQRANHYLVGNEELCEFMDQLTTASNVRRYIELPMIAVMGDTSSGKSSLLSALSMVELPSSDQITTRCPIQLQMKRNHAHKTATVTIQWKTNKEKETNGEGRKQRQGQGRRDSKNNITTTAFHRSVDEKSWNKLTGYITEAQETILKAHEEAEDDDDEHDDDDEEDDNNQDEEEGDISGKTTTAKEQQQQQQQQQQQSRPSKRFHVAKDIVQVRVTGPHCEDLTLLDLPGIVRSTGKGEDESLIDEIESLLQEYLHNSRCIILAVIPANVDFHNSQIMAGARRVDPETRRTLPVITKPDLIDPGAEDAIQDLLLGRKTDAFVQGFHMVKCRGQRALKDRQSLEEGLKEEVRFFESREPWKSVDNRSLFGTASLRTKLGALQMQTIREDFPTIQEEIRRELRQATIALRGMGDLCHSLGDKRQLYFDVVRKLIQQVDNQVQGKKSGNTWSSSSSFASSSSSTVSTTVTKKPLVPASTASTAASLASAFHDACDAFSKTLAQSRLAQISDLTVGVSVVVSNGTSEFKGTVISRNATHVWIDPEDLEDPACHKCIQFSVGTSTEPEGTYWTTPFNQLAMVRSEGNYDVLLAIPHNKVRRDASWIQHHLKQSRSLMDLPIFPNPAVFNNIVSECIEEDWEQECFQLLDTVMQLLRTTLETSLVPDGRLTRYPKFISYLKARLKDVAKQSYDAAMADLSHYLEKEKKPYTQNDYLSETIAKLRSKWLEQAMSEALGVGAVGSFDPYEAVSKSQINATLQAVFDYNRQKSLDDHMAEDMQHLLDAYGKVAFKRFADEVPKIGKEILVNYAKLIDDALTRMPPDEATLDVLIQESPENRLKMEQLQAKVEDLEEGLAIIDGLTFYSSA